MNIPTPDTRPPLPLHPLRGSLYKRKGGRYIPATSAEPGRFWFDYRLPGRTGRTTRVALRTDDYATAYCRAQALVIKSAQWADEAFLKRKVAAQASRAREAARLAAPPAFDQPRAVTVAEALGRRVTIAGLWTAVRDRYDARAKSLEVYRQQAAKFMKFAAARGLVYAEEVTRAFAEDYARWLYARVTTAAKHIGCLRRIWRLLFPDAETSPWNLSIHLQPKQREKAMNYRPLSYNEIQRVRQAIERLKARPGLLGARARILTADLLEDLGDAVVLSYHYGLRIGSFEAVRWADFHGARGTWTHRPPKTSRATLGADYPILPAAAAILDRRGGPAAHGGKEDLLPAFAAAHRASEQALNLAIKAVFRLAAVEDSPLRGRASWHSFRATFITRLTEAGCPLAIVKELAQHTKGDMTQRYVHVSMDQKLHWLLRLRPLDPVDPDAAYPTEPELTAPARAPGAADATVAPQAPR